MPDTGEWRRIEDAPMNGEDVLILWVSGHISIHALNQTASWFYSRGMMHWQPLPKSMPAELRHRKWGAPLGTTWEEGWALARADA